MKARPSHRSQLLSRTSDPEGDPADQALFESLLSLRKALAEQQGVPAYIVFSDKVLQELVARRPETPDEMLAVPGVGPAKLKRYGSVFLTHIRDWG